MVLIHPDAANEVRAAAFAYEDVNRDLLRAFVDDVGLAIDRAKRGHATSAYGLPEGMRATSLDRFGYRLYFYEDPIRPLNPQSLQTVRDKVNLPIATGEQLAHKWEFQPLIENELIDYLRIDLVHAGGITEAKKILAAGEVHGQRSALHHASSPVNGTACLHVDMAVPNFGIQEWMELEPLYELFPNAPRAHAGYVTPPGGPGLGLELDEAEARKRPSRDARLPQRYWPDGSVGDY